MIARIYTLNEYYEIFEDIFNRTYYYKDNEFRKLIVKMFEIFRTYTYLENDAPATLIRTPSRFSIGHSVGIDSDS